MITPPGEGGIAAIRVAGPDSLAILSKLFQPQTKAYDSIQPFLLRYGHFFTDEGEIIDEVTAVYMPEGQSYTGLDQFEIFCHAGRQVVKMVLAETIKAGARPAEPGEFTRLAFLNGRIDLARAEAVAEIIASNTRHSYETSRQHLLGTYSRQIEQLRDELVGILAEVEASIDFTEEDIDPSDIRKLGEKARAILGEIESLLSTYTGGRIINEGFVVAIAGRPNAGKSSLFNLLLKQQRALVNPTAGTTRDYLSEWVDIGGFAVNLIDTAGLRVDGDEIEQAGQSLARGIMEKADLIVWLVDVAGPDWTGELEEDIRLISGKKLMVVANKIDLVDRSKFDGIHISISCQTGMGLAELKDALLQRINENMPDLTSGLVVTSARHQEKLTTAADSLKQTIEKLEAGDSPDVIAFDLRQATNALDEITGKIYTEEILGHIFSSFCIGK